MPETKEVKQDVVVNEPTATAKRGSVQRAEYGIQPNGELKELPENNKASEGDTQPPVKKDGAAADITSAAKVDGDGALATEQTFKDSLEKIGIKFNGSIEDFKKKLEQPEKTTEPVKETAEEKKAKDISNEKRMLDKFMSNNGSIEQFTALKNIVNADLKELSLSELKRELKEVKFSDSEIENVIKERYYQIADDELDQYEDETEKEFLKRKKEYGSKLLESRSLSIKEDAGRILDSLKSDIESEDLAKQKEEKLSSKIDEHFKKAPRKLTFQLGKENDREIDPIEYEVSEADVEDVRNTLKDPAQRHKFLFNEEGELNVKTIADILLRNKVLESAVKASYLSGETKTTEKLRGTFGGSSPYSIGIGGADHKIGQSGRVVKSGKPQRVMPSN